MWDIIGKGGPLMIPIIGCSVLALAIVIERLWHLRRARINTKKFMDNIADRLRRNRIKEAVDICDATPGPIAHILKAGILKHDRSRQEIREAIEDAGLHEIPRLERNVEVLGTIGHISPLLGLLGTVVGMVEAFRVIQDKAVAFHPINPGDLAGGIWAALITTVAGLTVAIPTLVAYHYILSRVDGMVWDMEKSATDVINLLTQRGE